MNKMLSFKYQGQGVVEHTYPSTTGEAEARRAYVQSQPGLHSETVLEEKSERDEDILR